MSRHRSERDRIALDTGERPPRQGRRPRVRALLSDTETECGAACLAMVLTYYGRSTSVAETAESCAIGRDGVSALTITRAAREYGLDVTPLAVHDLDRLRHLQLPAVLYWSFNHFVVLERFDRRGAVVCDPARGRVHVARTELDRNFTGIVLTMVPGDRFRERTAPDPAPGWRIARAILASGAVRWLFVRVFLASVVLMALGLVVPLTMGLVVDTVLPERLGSVLTVAAAAGVLLIGCHGLMEYMRGVLLVELHRHVDQHLMSTFFSHLLRLPLSFFQTRATGDLLQRMDTNNEVRMALTEETLGGLLDSLLVVVYASFIVVASPVFGLVTIALGLIYVALVVVAARRLNALVIADLIRRAQLDGFCVEALRGVHSLKAAGNEQWALTRWNALFQAQQAAVVRRSRFVVVISAGMSAITYASPLVLLLVGATQVLAGRLTVGGMIGLLALSDQLLSPIARLAAAGQQLVTVSGHLRRLTSALDAIPEQAQVTAGAPLSLRTAPELTGAIELQGVAFRHPGAQDWALQDIWLDIRPGTHVAVVGSSGSGKSTLLKIILGLHEPTAGRVLIDGMDLTGLDYPSLRRQCGVVTQETTVFHGTIRQNIALGDRSPSFDTVRRAAELADLDRDIAGMPMGYETLVSEGGATLSGGQRQRLALARALVHRPRILLLDEATSALDPLTQATVQRNLAGLQVTLVTVAHRLATIDRADTVVLLDRGRVVDIGAPSSLAESSAAYSRLLEAEMAQ